MAIEEQSLKTGISENGPISQGEKGASEEKK